jgi:hypothetical protein
MKYLHIAILEHYDECLVSNTIEGLREQVNEALIKKSLHVPTDEEWLNCILAKNDCPDNVLLSVITYYKTPSMLEEEVLSD